MGGHEEINKKKVTRRSDYQIIILYSFYYISLSHSVAAFGYMLYGYGYGYGTRRHTNCVEFVCVCMFQIVFRSVVHFMVIESNVKTKRAIM